MSPAAERLREEVFRVGQGKGLMGCSRVKKIQLGRKKYPRSETGKEEEEGKCGTQDCGCSMLVSQDQCRKDHGGALGFRALAVCKVCDCGMFDVGCFALEFRLDSVGQSQVEIHNLSLSSSRNHVPRSLDRGRRGVVGSGGTRDKDGGRDHNFFL